MKVFGISLVRNEADIIRLTVLHHLSLGLDRILVLDNGSTDGTGEILQELADRDERVVWIRDGSPFDQAAITTKLAREAHRQGAEWIFPFDADEFWWTRDNNIKETMSRWSAGALRVSLINFVQARHQHESAPEALLTMTQRVAEPASPGPHVRELIESRQIGFVEMTYPAKWIVRATPEIEIHRGNHRVMGIKGQRKVCDEIVILHAPLRSRAILEARVERRIRLEEAGISMDSGGWHIAYWTRTKKEGMMDREWAANSYEDDHLDVFGERHKVVFDPRLRDAVAPLIHNRSQKVSSLRKRLFGGIVSVLRKSF